MLSSKTTSGQMEYGFDNPVFSGKEPDTSCLVPKKTSLKFWIEDLTIYECSSKKTQCSSISFAGSMDYSFKNPANGFLSKCKKKSPRARRKRKNYKTPGKTDISTNDPLNLLNAVLRAVAKLIKQKFDIFLLMSELKAGRVPVNPLKSFLWTRSGQFWKPHGKTIDKRPKKKMS